MGTIGFVGGGNMAEALIKGIIEAGVYKPDSVFVSDIRADRLDYLAKQYNVRTASENSEVAGKVDTLVLCVKPQKMAEALQSIKDAVKSDTLVISIAAGVRIANIAKVLGDVGIIRIMPNTPALIGEAASALFATEKAKPMLDTVMKIFSSVGKAVIVENEDLLDSVTAVSGSGPAYYFLLMEEMIKAAGQLGLAEDVAKELVLQTAKGAALLASEADKKGETPAELRRKVTSPGGTTEAAIRVFTELGFGDIVNKALKKARDRSRELAK